MRDRELREKCTRVVAESLDRSGDVVFGLAVVSDDSDERALDVTCEVLQTIRADRESKVLRRDVLDLMRFVENRVGAGRNHFAVRVLPYGGIGAQKMVVDDDDV